jgi:anti-sigma factor RsiW
MHTASTGHPSAESLRAFALGRLGDEESAAIEAHLAACSECQQVVEDTPVDSLVETLRQPAPAIVVKSAGAPPHRMRRYGGWPGAMRTFRRSSGTIRATKSWNGSAPVAWAPCSRPGIGSWTVWWR